MNPAKPFSSVILAGERPGGNALSQALNLSASVMVPVAGKPALERVMAALEKSQLVSSGLICGPSNEVIQSDPILGNLLTHSSFNWLAPANGPSASALAAVEKLQHYPCLITAGDHALLLPEIVDNFCAAALEQGRSDLVIGLVPYPLVKAAWPESKRTRLKFSDGQFCGSNLFACLNPEGKKALEFWQQLEADRKHPWKLARKLGIRKLLAYLLGRISSTEAFTVLSDTATCRISYVTLNQPRAAVDVDSIADQQLAEQILSSD